MTGKQVGLELGQIRKEKGISKLELSRRTGVHRNTIAYMEAGNMFNVDTMACIATGLGIRLSDAVRAAEDRTLPIVESRFIPNRDLRRVLTEKYGLSPWQRKLLTEEMLDQLDKCEDYTAIRLLLGVSTTFRPKGLKARRAA